MSMTRWGVAGAALPTIVGLALLLDQVLQLLSANLTTSAQGGVVLVVMTGIHLATGCVLRLVHRTQMSEARPRHGSDL